jgi:hypothetical protein
MTPYEQVSLFLIILFPVVIVSLWVIDYILEGVDTVRTRNRTWRAIEIRSAMERHPSSQVDVFDQDAEG